MLGIAAVNVAIIALEYMGLRRAPPWLRNLMLGWIAAVTLTLIGLFV